MGVLFGCGERTNFFGVDERRTRLDPLGRESGAHSDLSGLDGIAVLPDLPWILSPDSVSETPRASSMSGSMSQSSTQKGTLRISACTPCTSFWCDGKGFSFFAGRRTVGMNDATIAFLHADLYPLLSKFMRR